MLSFCALNFLAHQAHLLLIIEDDIVVLGNVVGIHLRQEDLIFFFDLDFSEVDLSEVVVMVEVEAYGGAE